MTELHGLGKWSCCAGVRETCSLSTRNLGKLGYVAHKWETHVLINLYNFGTVKRILGTTWATLIHLYFSLKTLLVLAIITREKTKIGNPVITSPRFQASHFESLFKGTRTTHLNRHSPIKKTQHQDLGSPATVLYHWMRVWYCHYSGLIQKMPKAVNMYHRCNKSVSYNVDF